MNLIISILCHKSFVLLE
uniref:Uncharacterized protein n=1 Tax=Arundo donax TaxID=35708 RepID=A0A0A9C3A4_ARUDO